MSQLALWADCCQHDKCPHMKREIIIQTCTEERAWEDKERRPSISQGKRPQKTSTLTSDF